MKVHSFTKILFILISACQGFMAHSLASDKEAERLIGAVTKYICPIIDKKTENSLVDLCQNKPGDASNTFYLIEAFNQRFAKILPDNFFWSLALKIDPTLKVPETEDDVFADCWNYYEKGLIPIKNSVWDELPNLLSREKIKAAIERELRVDNELTKSITYNEKEGLSLSTLDKREVKYLSASTYKDLGVLIKRTLATVKRINLTQEFPNLSFLQHFPQVEFFNCFGINLKTIEEISVCKSLKKLAFRKCRFPVKELAYIPDSVRELNLQSFVTSEFVYEQRPNLLELLKHLFHLEILVISDFRHRSWTYKDHKEKKVIPIPLFNSHLAFKQFGSLKKIFIHEYNILEEEADSEGIYTYPHPGLTDNKIKVHTLNCYFQCEEVDVKEFPALRSKHHKLKAVFYYDKEQRVAYWYPLIDYLYEVYQKSSLGLLQSDKKTKIPFYLCLPEPRYNTYAIRTHLNSAKTVKFKGILYYDESGTLKK